MLLGLTKRKIFYFIVILFFIVNIFTAFLIFFDIQIISIPKTEIFVDIIEVNSDEIIISTSLNMINKNGFEISIKDFVITSLNNDGVELGKLKLSGGKIPSDESRIFSTTGKIKLKDFKGNIKGIYSLNDVKKIQFARNKSDVIIRLRQIKKDEIDLILVMELES